MNSREECVCVCVCFVLVCGGSIWNHTSSRTELEEHLVHVGENVILLHVPP